MAYKFLCIWRKVDAKSSKSLANENHLTRKADALADKTEFWPNILRKIYLLLRYAYA